MNNKVKCLLICLGLSLLGTGCGERNAPMNRASNVPAKNIGADVKLFPPEEACNYPSRSSIPKFRDLGGGKWRHMVVGGTDFGYDCGTPEKQVYLVSPSVDAYIEYGVVGTEKGAKTVGFDYNINTTLANEAELRKEFVVLLDEVTRLALKEPLPDSAKSKILDLKTFSNAGVRNEDVFPIGEGRLELSRNSNPSVPFILVKVSICPDKNVKCS